MVTVTQMISSEFAEQENGTATTLLSVPKYMWTLQKQLKNIFVALEATAPKQTDKLSLCI
jgi:hypothetical protein